MGKISPFHLMLNVSMIDHSLKKNDNTNFDYSANEGWNRESFFFFMCIDLPGPLAQVIYWLPISKHPL